MKKLKNREECGEGKGKRNREKWRLGREGERKTTRVFPTIDV
jgi:hypothetical protein